VNPESSQKSSLNRDNDRRQRETLATSTRRNLGPFLCLTGVDFPGVSRGIGMVVKIDRVASRLITGGHITGGTVAVLSRRVRTKQVLVQGNITPRVVRGPDRPSDRRVGESGFRGSGELPLGAGKPQ
jgi:hypothetical protein